MIKEDEFKKIVFSLAQISAVIVSVYITLLIEDGVGFIEIIVFSFYYFVSLFVIVILVIVIKEIVEWKQKRNTSKRNS